MSVNDDEKHAVRLTGVENGTRKIEDAQVQPNEDHSSDAGSRVCGVAICIYTSIKPVSDE